MTRHGAARLGPAWRGEAGQGSKGPGKPGPFSTEKSQIEPDPEPVVEPLIADLSRLGVRIPDLAALALVEHVVAAGVDEGV